MPKCPSCNRPVTLDAASCPYCRAPLVETPAPPAENLEQRVGALLAQGKKIEAIKIYREETGAGLADAKQAVEALQAGAPLPLREMPPMDQWQGDVLRLLAAGKKIQAIKLYREHTGSGLKDAKEAVEALGAQHGIAPSGGCLAVVVIAAISAWVVWWV